jgi:sortase A
VRRTIAAIGRLLVTVGLLILLFVTYELWGTGIFTARDQSRLKSQFHRELLQTQQDNPVVTAPTT